MAKRSGRAGGFANIVLMSSAIAGALWWGLDGLAWGALAGFFIVIYFKMHK